MARESHKDSCGLFSMPYQMMAFAVPPTKQIDFSLEINEDFPSWSMEDAIQVYGSKEHSNPTYIYKNPDGSFELFCHGREDELQLAFHTSSTWDSYILHSYIRDLDSNELFLRLFHMYSYGMIYHNALMLHGVVMEYEGKGYIISAASGTGKSTHARMWRNHENALILNGDKALVRYENGSWFAYGAPWYGTSGECINRKVPLAALVMLDRGEHNEICKENTLWKISRLLERIYAPTFDVRTFETAMNTVESLVAGIPVIHLKCLPDLDSVALLKKEIK
ncbi:hypothetical protein LJC58_09730 [Lachnospiraceae bacterium OttesenSCG-928-D06]|nr:hypothetical protein [Lachnospiraceae bacterium OttesenSCG-928-D06]